VTSLTVDEIITLRSKLTAATGGSGGLRDRGLLESAVMNRSDINVSRFLPTAAPIATLNTCFLINS
jgi:prophage maintenance system killer protein